MAWREKLLPLNIQKFDNGVTALAEVGVAKLSPILRRVQSIAAPLEIPTIYVDDLSYANDHGGYMLYRPGPFARWKVDIGDNHHVTTVFARKAEGALRRALKKRAVKKIVNQARGK